MKTDLLPPFYLGTGLVAAALVGGVLFVLSNFPANHHLAAAWTEADWARVAAANAAISCAVAAVGGLVWGGMGTLAVRFCAFDPSFERQGYRQAVRAALACALVAAAPGVVGSAMFFVERPVF